MEIPWATAKGVMAPGGEVSIAVLQFGSCLFDAFIFKYIFISNILEKLRKILTVKQSKYFFITSLPRVLTTV